MRAFLRPPVGFAPAREDFQNAPTIKGTGMETAHRRKAAMAMGTLPRYAGGGLIDGFKRVIGMAPESPELKAYKERAAAERAAKQNPAPTPEATPKPAISDYVGNSALDKRMKAADAMASGGPVTGPGTGTSDEVPILASNGEFMVRKAAVDAVGVDVLEAINALGENKSTQDGPGDKQPGKYAVGGEVDEPKPGEYGRQMGEMGASFGRGVGNVGRALEVMGKTVVSAPGYGLSSNNPAAPSDAVPHSWVQNAPPAPSVPAPAATPSAAAVMQHQVGNAGQSDAREPYQPQFPVKPAASFVTPAAPGNSFGDSASWNSNRTPMSAQDKMAMDGIQQRQDLRDSNGLSRMQYDSEVAGANAVNEWQANRGKSTARLAMEGKLAQDVRGDATARYQTDVNAGTSRYATDMQRENNRGQLGISQGRLSNETTTSGVDVAGKQQILDAQRALITAKTPEERKSATEILASLQGRATVPQADEYAYAPGGQEVDPVSSQLVTRPGVIFNKRTGAVGSPQQAGGSISTDPRAIAIRDNKQLSREQKLAELKKIGYQ